jgi:hypothetical protein
MSVIPSRGCPGEDARTATNVLICFDDAVSIAHVTRYLKQTNSVALSPQANYTD